MPADTSTCLSALALLRALYHREAIADEWPALTASIPERSNFRPSSLDQTLGEPNPTAPRASGD